jgi:hypothetical protein
MYLRKLFLIIESKLLLVFLLIVSVITLLIESFKDSSNDFVVGVEATCKPNGLVDDCN